MSLQIEGIRLTRELAADLWLARNRIRPMLRRHLDRYRAEAVAEIIDRSHKGETLSDCWRIFHMPTLQVGRRSFEDTVCVVLLRSGEDVLAAVYAEPHSGGTLTQALVRAGVGADASCHTGTSAGTHREWERAVIGAGAQSVSEAGLVIEHRCRTQDAISEAETDQGIFTPTDAHVLAYLKHWKVLP